jgi:type III secretion system needle length determinant
MKTNETRPASQPHRMTASDEPKKKGAFSKVLERKAGEEKMPQAAVEAPPVQPMLRPSSASEETHEVRGALPARDLDSLAQEIAVTVRGGDVREVEIRMDSKTMPGLEIRIAKENGKLSVKMQTESADLSRLLAQQTDALAHRLEARGYPGAVVQVQNPTASTFGEARGKDRRGQDSGRGDSQQKQGRQK